MITAFHSRVPFYIRVLIRRHVPDNHATYIEGVDVTYTQVYFGNKWKRRYR
jgi:hypothetical protein